MTRATWVNAKYKSIDEGLDELQKEFLSLELSKDHSRPVSVLRSLAKANAFKQKVRWFMQDALLVAGMLMIVAFTAAVLFISQM